MSLVRIGNCILILFAASSAFAKMPLQYLRTVYSEADVVARVVVLSQHELTSDLAEYEIKVLKPIKGLTNEKTIKAVAIQIKPMPADYPHLSEGDVGMIFLQREKGTGKLRLNRFLLSEDFLTNTYTLLCKPPNEHCNFSKFSEIEDFLNEK